METYKAKSIIRDKHSKKILGYELEDSTGKIIKVESSKIKDVMKLGTATILNLQLTSDNRLRVKSSAKSERREDMGSIISFAEARNLATINQLIKLMAIAYNNTKCDYQIDQIAYRVEGSTVGIELLLLINQSKCLQIGLRTDGTQYKVVVDERSKAFDINDRSSVIECLSETFMTIRAIIHNKMETTSIYVYKSSEIDKDFGTVLFGSNIVLTSVRNKNLSTLNIPLYITTVADSAFLDYNDIDTIVCDRSLVHSVSRAIKRLKNVEIRIRK